MGVRAKLTDLNHCPSLLLSCAASIVGSCTLSARKKRTHFTHGKVRSFFIFQRASMMLQYKLQGQVSPNFFGVA